MSKNNNGKVYLVGAGPGSPDLLTLKAVKLLESATYVVHDRLVSREILNIIPSNCKLISVGKEPGNHLIAQSKINMLLIDLANEGNVVVRLKGGDPLIFGRVGEEVEALRAAKITYEVVPGITAAQGCSAAAKMPLTHRDLVRGVQYITGHRSEKGDLDFDWNALANSNTTIVIYMGVGAIREIIGNLINAGLNINTPMLIVSNATRDNESMILTNLKRIYEDREYINKEKVKPPTLFIIGQVAGMADI